MTDQEIQDAVSEAGLDWQRGFDLNGENRYAKLVRSVLAAAQAKRIDMDRDYIDGINITDLQRALTWFGVASEESHEWVAAKMAEHINGLTYAVLRHKEAFDAERSLQAAAQAKPIDMVLHCPKCGMQHIDGPELHHLDAALEHNGLPGVPDASWTNPPHRSHLCHGCDHIWRPADVPTNGVAAVKTAGKTAGKNDSPVAAAQAKPSEDSKGAVPLEQHNRLTQHGLPWTEQRLDAGGFMAAQAVFGTGSEVDDKRVYRAIQAYLGAAQAKPAVPDVDVPRLVTAARMVTQYRLMMSYNEAYFGEPVGVFKQRVVELERALPPIYPAASISAPPHTGAE